MSPPSTELIHSKINSEPKKNKNKKERPDATIFGWRKCGAASPRTFPTQRCTQVRIPDYPSKTVSIDGVTSSHTYIWRISSSILIRDLKVRMAQTSPIWNVRLLDGLKRCGSCGSSICSYDSGMTRSSYRPVLWRIAFVVVPDGDMKGPSISILLKRFL
ncbi:hypothetical protein M404DRAFT_1001505, partial [Pisolithus tinctorius Marx 270]